ncbi:MAG: 2Fe-2S iron-sulfur cluster binding domain-containing protein [Euryarchaeota archaeon]|nr:2Fe-2S iron-sulfur cluster binding domain-containing protein [Euryarchaeota archaeon]
MNEAIVALVRFFRGSALLGSTPLVENQTLLQHAEDAGVEIPSNCTSGTCGSCMVTLLSGQIPLPEDLPPGLDDEFLIEQHARLSCIGIPSTSVDIELSPPL